MSYDEDDAIGTGQPCNEDLKKAGLGYPKHGCARCSLGPCTRYPPVEYGIDPQPQPGPAVVVAMSPKPSPTASANDAFRRELPDLIDRAVLIAKMRRAYFDAYVKEGFTVEEALKLCVQ